MENYLEYKEFELIDNYDKHMDNQLYNTVKTMPGINEIKYSKDRIGILYNNYLISDNDIITLMAELGYTVKNTTKKTGLLGSWINKLAKSNTQNFGNQKLDCCNLNKH